MSRTTFSGPVKSDNGFEGSITGPVAATTLSTTGEVTIDGTSVIISDLPTEDPAVAGQLYVADGALMVSAGV